MKTLMLVLTMNLAGTAFALPIVNVNVAPVGTATIYPDHQNPSLFYMAPTSVEPVRNQDGVPSVNLYRHREPGGRLIADLILWLHPDYDGARMEAAKQAVARKHPGAVFSELPFAESSPAPLQGIDVFRGMILSQHCTDFAGQLGHYRLCDVSLSELGIKVMRDLLRQRALVLAVNVVYDFDAVEILPDGKFRPVKSSFGVAARLDGGDLGKYPEIVKQF